MSGENMLLAMRAVIEAGNDADPMVELWSEDGLLMTILFGFDKDRSRYDVARTLGALGRCFGANRAIFAADSYYRAYAKDEQVVVRPSEDPLATEMVVVIEFTSSGGAHQVSHPYSRDGGTVRWLEPEFADDADEAVIIGGDVADGFRDGLINTFPLLFPTDAPRIMQQVADLTGNPVMVMAVHEKVLRVFPDNSSPDNSSN